MLTNYFQYQHAAQLYSLLHENVPSEINQNTTVIKNDFHNVFSILLPKLSNGAGKKQLHLIWYCAVQSSLIV